MRTIADLPWRGTPVILRWEVRRFFCDDDQCAQVIFAEQLEPLAPRRRRTTRRLDQALATIGVECGGEPGRRLSAELGIHTSGDTILRRVRALPLEQKLTPRVIGIDDFALRKGHRYGTVVVDHESHRVVDLLPDRSSESTAHWLASQPQVELVTRDRSTLYAKGISTSNPDAVQVADRFHLHANLREALVRLLDRHHAEISAAAKVAAENTKTLHESTPTSEEAKQADVTVAQAECVTGPAINEPAPPAAPDPATLSKVARLSMQRRARRLEKYQKVVALQDSGMSLRAIARQLGIGRDSVTKFLRARSFPERAKTRRPRGINRVADELRRLWDSDIHNARELHRKLRATGFTGSYQMVCRQVAPWRDAVIQSNTPGRNARPRPVESKPLRISSNRLSWLLLQSQLEREPGEEQLIQQLLATCEPVRTACELALEFKQIMPAGQSEPLRQWIGRASGAEVAMEIRSFAEGLERDWPSVKAAIELPWSNGRAEGHVNRIKLIKRKMYGRANFDLLRIRVMTRGP
jgi:transposase